MALRVESFELDSGEDYCLLIADDGLPLTYPNLFVTTRVRNASLSFHTMEQHLHSIAVLLDFCEQKTIDLEQRVLSREFFSPLEVDAICSHCLNRRKPQNDIILIGKRKHPQAQDLVLTSTAYIRVIRICEYLQWLTEVLLRRSYDVETAHRLERLLRSFHTRMRRSRGKNSGDEAVGLTYQQEVDLLDTIASDGEGNPFKQEAVRVRNECLIKLMLRSGLRLGEVLGLYVSDIDFTTCMLTVHRRPDNKADKRKVKPKTKTRARVLQLLPQLAEELRSYIVRYRKRTPNTSAHPFLFVNHGNHNLGQPMSRSAVYQLLKKVKSVSPETLQRPHQTRHTFGDRLKEELGPDGKNIPDKKRIEMLNQAMGWSENSKSHLRYTKATRQKQTHKAMVQMQEAAEERQAAARSRPPAKKTAKGEEL